MTLNRHCQAVHSRSWQWNRKRMDTDKWPFERGYSQGCRSAM